jgi:hypothetical protein
MNKEKKIRFVNLVFVDTNITISGEIFLFKKFEYLKYKYKINQRPE